MVNRSSNQCGRAAHGSRKQQQVVLRQPDINAKLAAADQLSGAARYDAYGNLDVEIMIDHAPIVPLFNRANRLFNSARVGGFVYQPALQIVDLNTFFIK